MRTYRIESEFGSWLMQMDPAQASAPIRTSGISDAPSWQHTPYQTADAQHSPQRAAELLANYFGDETGELAETIESVEVVEA